MKFKFCGDGDCPLWALAGLTALGSLPLATFKQFLAYVLDKDELDESQVLEILADTKLGTAREAKRAVATARWVARGARRWPGAPLAHELQLLGLARGHAHALRDAAAAGESLHDGKLMVNRVTKLELETPHPDTVDCVQLRLHLADSFTRQTGQQTVLIQRDQLPGLLAELKRAREIMREIQ